MKIFSVGELKTIYKDLEKGYQPAVMKEELLNVILDINRAGALNTCKTQKLNMMNITPMSVEFRDKAKGKQRPIKSSRIIPVALPLRDKTIKILKMMYI